MGAGQSTTTTSAADAADAYETFDKKLLWKRVELYNKLKGSLGTDKQEAILRRSLINYSELKLPEILLPYKDEQQKEKLYTAIINAIDKINSRTYTVEEIKEIEDTYNQEEQVFIDYYHAHKGGRRKSKRSRKNRRKTTKRR